MSIRPVGLVSVPRQKILRNFQAFCHKAHNGELLTNSLINVDITLTKRGKRVKNATMDSIIRRYKAEILKE